MDNLVTVSNGQTVNMDARYGSTFICGAPNGCHAPSAYHFVLTIEGKNLHMSTCETHAVDVRKMSELQAIHNISDGCAYEECNLWQELPDSE